MSDDNPPQWRSKKREEIPNAKKLMTCRKIIDIMGVYRRYDMDERRDRRRRPNPEGRRTDRARRRKLQRQRKRRRRIFISIVVLLIAVIAAAIVIWKKYGPSHADADLNNYFGIKEKIRRRLRSTMRYRTFRQRKKEARSMLSILRYGIISIRDFTGTPTRTNCFTRCRTARFPSARVRQSMILQTELRRPITKS